MNRKTIACLLAVLWLSVSAVYAQKQTLTGISKFNASGISPIFEKNEVKGYMLYYKTDKADKKNDNYVIDVYDQDLNKVKSIVMQKPRNRYVLLRNTYNGKVFSFYFYNAGERALELETYDRGLNKLASHKITELSKVDKVYIEQELARTNTGNNNVLTGMNLYAVPEKGFIRNSYEGLGKSYELEMFDNDLKLKWRYKPEGKSKDYETISITEVTDRYAMGTIIRRPNMLSQKMTFYLAAFDIETGKKIMDEPVETGGTEQLSFSSMNFDAQKQEFIVLGEFYNADDKPFVHKSQGFFIKRFDLTGKEKSAKFYGWGKEVKSLLPAAASKSVEENYINYIHKIIKDANGNMYLVAEQYKIVVSGAGIAMKALGAKTSTMKGKIGNMMVFAIDPADALKEVKFYEKEETDCMLPAGSGLYGAGLLGHLIKMDGGFDYQFTQESNDATDFSIAYLNFDRKGKGIKTSLVNVLLDDAGSFSTDNIDITTGKKTRAITYPAKVGYNMVVDYSSDEKAMEMKLVKLNK